MTNSKLKLRLRKNVTQPSVLSRGSSASSHKGAEDASLCSDSFSWEHSSAATLQHCSTAALTAGAAAENLRFYSYLALRLLQLYQLFFFTTIVPWKLSQVTARYVLYLHNKNICTKTKYLTLTTVKRKTKVYLGFKFICVIHYNKILR